MNSAQESGALSLCGKGASRLTHVIRGSGWFCFGFEAM
jgi:hypothetical protein